MTVEEVERLSGTIESYLKRLAAAAVSYCWETREHPDPEGNSFLALADALEKCYEEKKKEPLFQYRHFPEDIAIFWDYPCLFQHPPGGKRTEEQDRVFKVRAAPPLLLLLCCSHALHLFRHTHMHAVWPREPRSGLCARRHDHLPASRLGAAHSPVLRTRTLGRHTHTPSPTLCRHSPQQRPSPTHCQPSSLHSLKVDGPRTNRVRAPPRSLSSASAHASPLTLSHLLHRIATQTRRASSRRNSRSCGRR